MNKLRWLKKCLARKQRKFTSGIDAFLMCFDREHYQKSSSQQAEIMNYKKIHQSRDRAHNIDNVTEPSSLWSSFN